MPAIGASTTGGHTSCFPRVRDAARARVTPSRMARRRGRRPRRVRGGTWLRHRPLLVGAARAVPDLQPGAVRRAPVLRVQAPVGLRVDDIAGGRDDPLLIRAAPAVPQLDQGAVVRGVAGDVHALAQGPDRTVATERPALRERAVAVPQLDRGAVGRVGAVDVDALAAVPADAAAAATPTTTADLVHRVLRL